MSGSELKIPQTERESRVNFSNNYELISRPLVPLQHSSSQAKALDSGLEKFRDHLVKITKRNESANLIKRSQSLHPLTPSPASAKKVIK